MVACFKVGCKLRPNMQGRAGPAACSAVALAVLVGEGWQVVALWQAGSGKHRAPAQALQQRHCSKKGKQYHAPTCALSGLIVGSLMPLSRWLSCICLGCGTEVLDAPKCRRSSSRGREEELGRVRSG